MWHFAKDGKFEYKNGFSLTWGFGREVLRAYTKSLNGKKLRNEKQEYPNKTQEDAFKDKLDNNDGNKKDNHNEDGADVK